MLRICFVATANQQPPSNSLRCPFFSHQLCLLSLEAPSSASFFWLFLLDISKSSDPFLIWSLQWEDIHHSTSTASCTSLNTPALSTVPTPTSFHSRWCSSKHHTWGFFFLTTSTCSHTLSPPLCSALGCWPWYFNPSLSSSWHLVTSVTDHLVLFTENICGGRWSDDTWCSAAYCHLRGGCVSMTTGSWSWGITETLLDLQTFGGERRSENGLNSNLMQTCFQTFKPEFLFSPHLSKLNLVRNIWTASVPLSDCEIAPFLLFLIPLLLPLSLFSIDGSFHSPPRFLWFRTKRRKKGLRLCIGWVIALNYRWSLQLKRDY